MPATWVSALRAARGIYLLTSAKTREQYVGSATGDGGFFGRWLNYAADGHGGNIGLKSSEALRSVYIEGSIFDSAYMTRLELAKFLTSLSHRITMPVMPDDEVSDYLITQAIADYIAASTALNLDGMLYPSVQKAGAHQNVVLFRRASRVDELQFPDGAEVSAILDRYDEEGVSPDYWVSEKVPPAAVDEVEEEEDFGILSFSRHTYLDPFAEPGDDRERALKVAVDTIQVHHVEAISIKTHAYDVTRHMSEIRPSKFSKIEADPDF